MTDNKTIELDMVRNGLDFILKSLETINNNDEELKYSILNLHAGTQLVLKELLFHEHWSLIFQKIETAEKAKLNTGDFISVNHETLIQRLQKISGIKIDDRLVEKLEWLRKERNKIEHFKLVVSVIALKSNIAQLLSLFIPFVNKELVAKGLIPEDDIYMADIRSYLLEFEAYVDERMKLTREKLSEMEFVLNCPDCFQKTVEFDDATAFCHFCENKINDFKHAYIKEFVDTMSAADGGEYPVHECPECEQEYFINLEDDNFVCLNCGIFSSGEDLVRCGGPGCNGIFMYRRHYENESDFPEEYAVQFCTYCLDYFKNL